MIGYMSIFLQMTSTTATSSPQTIWKCLSKHLLQNTQGDYVCVPSSWLAQATKTTIDKRYLVPFNTLFTKSPTEQLITENYSSNKHKTFKFGLINIRSLSTKPLLINDFIVDHNQDMIGQYETWLKLLHQIFSAFRPKLSQPACL